LCLTWITATLTNDLLKLKSFKFGKSRWHFEMLGGLSDDSK
jgi:hypothetical protein